MLEIKNVTVEYYGDEFTLNLSLNKGVTLLLGEVGSFKTTIFKILGGIKEIKDGEIILDGVNIEELEPKDRNMALVSCDSAPISGTVRQALMLPMKLRGIKGARAKADELAKTFGLEPKHKIKKLTKRELILLFKARLSLRETKVTMFDEPYHFFLQDSTELITDMIISHSGYTLVSSCDGEDIQRLKPDYLVILRGNNVLQFGKTEDVLAAPINKYVAMLIG